MATVSSLQAQKRKKLMYGKTGKSAFGGTNFFDDDDDELSASQPSDARQRSVKEAYPLQKSEAKSHKVKPVEARAKAQDTFDVPSSDDEADSQRTRRKVSPPKYRPTLVEDTRTQQLAPWERKRKADSSTGAGQTTAKRHWTPEGSPEAQLKRELARATRSPEVRVSQGSSPMNTSPVPQRSSPANSPPEYTSQSVQTSTVARLAARKRLAESVVASSADEGSERSTLRRVPSPQAAANATPRKRARKIVESPTTSKDVVMVDVAQHGAAEDSGEPLSQHTDANDVFDFPGSDNEASKPIETLIQAKLGKLPVRRGKAKTYGRSKPLKGISAPARLAEMIPADSDSTEAPTRSPSVSTSRNSTPQEPSTPPSRPSGSPQTVVRASDTVTPKRANLWNRLLPSDPVVPSPSGLPLEDLSISGSRRSEPPQLKPRLYRSQSDTIRRRARLVDRLKASAPGSANESSDEEEVDDALEDTDMAEPTSHFQANIAAEVPKPQKQSSQSQTITAKSSSKITYARVRSHLKDDNLEAGMMLGLDNDPPLPTAAAKRAISGQTQSSAYDLDDSDEEDGPGKMRSIHELRAAGSNVRGMGDIEDLLDDIAKHNVTQRATRRTALVTLATRMMDKAFKERFVDHGCETKLVAECNGSTDDVADFVTIACLATLLENDPAEHVVVSLRDAQVLEWLATYPGKNTSINSLAKDRRSNMSKASQTSLLQYADNLKSHRILWNDHPPTSMTHRAIALKAIDLLVRAFRRSGDRSELLSGLQFSSILSSAHQDMSQLDPIDTMLAVSALESLSTTTMGLDWPSDIFEDIASILPRLNNTNQIRHTRFLALRLCLNLTNDNARNCGLLAQSNKGSVVPYLLEAIQNGFGDLGRVEETGEKAVVLDLLVLAIGIMINLSEHSDEARQNALIHADVLEALIGVFQYAQKHMLEAESEEESVANVTFGYLAVMLANLCQYRAASTYIASKLPGQNLRLLVVAVEEFVAHHHKVDTLNFEGDEGAEVWSAFTEKLRGVLERLKAVEAA